MAKLMMDRLRLQHRSTPLGDWLNATTVFYSSDSLSTIMEMGHALELDQRLVPPYDRFFIELELPGETSHAGALICAYDAGEGNLFGAQPVEECRWVFNIDTFMDDGDHVWRMARSVMAVNVAGQSVPLFLDGEMAYAFTRQDENFFKHVRDGFLRFKNPEVSIDEFGGVIRTVLDSALYTLMMINCRNIGTELIAPRRAEAHKFEKRNQLKMTSYYVLKLTGKGQAAGLTIGAPGQGHKALHWCRGHVRTYTDASPLFGKYTGTFYVGAHVRGHANEGIITKDYEINVSDHQAN